MMKRVKVHKVHKEGTGTLIGLLLLLAALLAACYYLLGSGVVFCVLAALSLGFYLIVVNFFRSPRRHFAGNPEGLVVAPADGTVVAVEEVTEHEYFRDRRLQVSVFMSVFNVHANWYPVNGTVTHVSHRNGRFQAAYLPKSSVDNERSTVVIKTPCGSEVLARQIAGAVARRIVTYAREGEECTVDDQMGFIKFGSRVDLFLPIGTEVLVAIDQQVTANQTIIARLPRPAAQ